MHSVHVAHAINVSQVATMGSVYWTPPYKAKISRVCSTSVHIQHGMIFTGSAVRQWNNILQPRNLSPLSEVLEHFLSCLCYCAATALWKPLSHSRFLALFSPKSFSKESLPGKHVWIETVGINVDYIHWHCRQQPDVCDYLWVFVQCERGKRLAFNCIIPIVGKHHIFMVFTHIRMC